ncbi:universal stress protein [Marimonas sp. MJW-29]|uniref:Universal stress protein n=1 Tax=Sulfitobacter sediminis TaxID=3234186 RepID=A0ABV3RSU2_9RHOB
MFRQIIVGLDGSEKAKMAARIGCDLAKVYAGNVTLVHVLRAERDDMDDEPSDNTDDTVPRRTLEELEAAGQRILDAGLAIAHEVGCKNVETHMPYGDAAGEILAHADRIEADLIVTGRRGLGSLTSLVLGSTTQRINHEAKCACLSVPHTLPGVKKPSHDIGDDGR